MGTDASWRRSLSWINCRSWASGGPVSILLGCCSRFRIKMRRISGSLERLCRCLSILWWDLLCCRTITLFIVCETLFGSRFKGIFIQGLPFLLLVFWSKGSFWVHPCLVSFPHVFPSFLLLCLHFLLNLRITLQSHLILVFHLFFVLASAYFSSWNHLFLSLVQLYPAHHGSFIKVIIRINNRHELNCLHFIAFCKSLIRIGSMQVVMLFLFFSIFTILTVSRKRTIWDIGKKESLVRWWCWLTW